MTTKDFQDFKMAEERYKIAMQLTKEEIEALPVKEVTIKEFFELLKNIDYVCLYKYIDRIKKSLENEQGLDLNYRYIVVNANDEA